MHLHTSICGMSLFIYMRQRDVWFPTPKNRSVLWAKSPNHENTSTYYFHTYFLGKFSQVRCISSFLRHYSSATFCYFYFIFICFKKSKIPENVKFKSQDLWSNCGIKYGINNLRREGSKCFQISYSKQGRPNRLIQKTINL